MTMPLFDFWPSVKTAKPLHSVACHVLVLYGQAVRSVMAQRSHIVLRVRKIFHILEMLTEMRPILLDQSPAPYMARRRLVDRGQQMHEMKRRPPP
eukprot:CAMPEP_0174383990 /NCGR_PEP_ID=MMETSP0811_2-20130205/125617_1 /TAXON_ID=73025 ORGANISM="Eutreptiella gymnastica-like, Strain CCMP1594" /NCGR_SAMPLE_ID=MMETSP0811_2 /ASSEMBLY_ACC=CAM_ASM_000667 /LENGTH=94 /DNA_ID=CAMNT_0015537787 /DNA_START=857 /DNA_END=1137 /DNA_ORIENTATION=-